MPRGTRFPARGMGISPMLEYVIELTVQNSQVHSTETFSPRNTPMHTNEILRSLAVIEPGFASIRVISGQQASLLLRQSRKASFAARHARFFGKSSIRDQASNFTQRLFRSGQHALHLRFVVRQHHIVVG